jgi:hypothetical protein
MASICGGEDEAQEIVRLRRIETSAEQGRFDADSIFFTDDYPLGEGALDFAPCKWAYERVSTDPPEAAAPGLAMDPAVQPRGDRKGRTKRRSDRARPFEGLRRVSPSARADLRAGRQRPCQRPSARSQSTSFASARP